MNNDNYLMSLKRALAGMDKSARDEILLELESHTQDSQNDDSLETQFGPVEQLAQEYLDGEPLPPSIGARLRQFSGRLVFGFGAITATGLILIAGLAWVFSGDKFDYADELALQHEIDESEWRQVAWSESLDLKVDQAHAVFYWHDKPQVQWRCKGRDNIDPVPGQVLRIRHGFCLIYLPQLPIDIDISQSDVVLIKPQTSVSATIIQGELRIAAQGNQYRYDFTTQHSDVTNFVSDTNAVNVIAINATESSIKPYEY